MKDTKTGRFVQYIDDKKCPVCSGIFHSSTSLTYCSRACYNISVNHVVRYANCQQCKIEFRIKNATKGMFCSKPCSYANRVGTHHNHRTSNGTSWNKGKTYPEYSNENHWHWTGDKVSYNAIHKWVLKTFGIPRECVYCGVRDLKRRDGIRSIQFANVSHEYKRDLTDWIPLCTPCHSEYDKAYRKNLNY